MSITLKSFKPEVESFVQQELASGRYESLDEVIEQALALSENDRAMTSGMTSRW